VTAARDRLLEAGWTLGPGGYWLDPLTNNADRYPDALRTQRVRDTGGVVPLPAAVEHECGIHIGATCAECGKVDVGLVVEEIKRLLLKMSLCQTRERPCETCASARDRVISLLGVKEQT